jgi:hypothetical protein
MAEVYLRPGIQTQSDRVCRDEPLRVLAIETWGDASRPRYLKLLLVNRRGQWAGAFEPTDIDTRGQV